MKCPNCGAAWDWETIRPYRTSKSKTKIYTRCPKCSEASQVGASSHTPPKVRKTTPKKKEGSGR